mmetsp:Transcript_44405/g.80437  ORF Transcript_44405/g.80437 Transcript_44405/m.80437 type:complete len:200 (-) Transcript_44405:390-989(-)
MAKRHQEVTVRHRVMTRDLLMIPTALRQIGMVLRHLDTVHMVPLLLLDMVHHLQLDMVHRHQLDMAHRHQIMVHHLDTVMGHHLHPTGMVHLRPPLDMARHRRKAMDMAPLHHLLMDMVLLPRLAMDMGLRHMDTTLLRRHQLAMDMHPLHHQVGTIEAALVLQGEGIALEKEEARHRSQRPRQSSQSYLGPWSRMSPW